MNNKHFFKKINHFTLLEMLLSVVIFAMIMLTIGAGLFSIQQTWNRMTKKNDELKVLQILDRIFDTAFRNTVRFTWYNYNNQKQSIFFGDKNECIVAYMHRITPSTNSGIRFLKLYLDNNNLIAAYRKYPILYWDENDQEMQKEIIATNIKNIYFLYGEKKNNDIAWGDDWDEANNHNIPAGIQITVEWESGMKEQWLRRTAGAGKFESFGKK